MLDDLAASSLPQGHAPAQVKPAEREIPPHAYQEHSPSREVDFQALLYPGAPCDSTRDARHILTHQCLQQAVEYLLTALEDVGQKRSFEVRVFGTHMREAFHLLFIEPVCHGRPRLADYLLYALPQITATSANRHLT